MATVEFYRDEHPKPGGGGGGGGGGGYWGGGDGGISGDGGWIPSVGGVIGGGGSSTPEIDDPWYLVGSWLGEDDLILVDGEGTILTNGFELLLAGCCMKIEIECQIKGEYIEHVACIILVAVPRKSDSANNSIFAGLLNNGEVDIYARWQKGHYDINSVNTVRFRLKGRNETITPWYRLNIEDAPGKRIMTLVVRDGIITTKNMG